MDILEHTVASMLVASNQGSRPFYAHLIQQMNRSYSTKIDTAGVCISTRGVNLLVNKAFFESLPLQTRMDVLEHECGHILRRHIARCKEANLLPKLHNIASDACINDSLESLKEMGVTVDKIRQAAKKYGLTCEVEDGQATEYYYAILQQIREKSGEENGEKGFETIDDHDIWQESEDLSPEMLDEICKNTIKRAAKKAGNVPYEVQALLDRVYGETLNWKSILKQFVTRVNKFTKQSTRKKLNRRYGLVYPGKKKKPNYTLAVAVDESGSVSDTNIQQFFMEIDKIVDAGAEVIVLHCDTQINQVYEYKKGMEIKRSGSGGTLYTPVMDKVRELDADGLIFFGDGDCYESEGEIPNPKVPVLWALNIDGREAPAKFGRTCYVSSGEK
jgi:predicted metal-dependent peptidase